MNLPFTKLMTNHEIPAVFIWRRVHSLMGLWLVLFLCEHLFVNAQSALWLGDDGKGFIALANLLQAIPMLQVIEIIFIGTPILVHTIWGIQRAYSAKTNSWPTGGSRPSLPWYFRNQTFTWQRISSWVLIAGIGLHVIQMRWINYPKKAFLNNQEQAMVRVSYDEGLDSLAKRLKVSLFSSSEIAAMKSQIDLMDREKIEWMKQLAQFRLNENQRVAVALERGTAILLTVRDVLKDPIMEVVYSLFVVLAVFHAFNGFWTFLLTWGFILSTASQKVFQKLGWMGIICFSLLGLISIWLTYWINLRS